MIGATLGPFMSGDKSFIPNEMNKVQVETNLTASASIVLDNFVIEQVIPNGDQGYMSEPLSDDLRQLYVLKTSPLGNSYLSPTSTEMASVEASDAQGLLYSSTAVTAVASSISPVSVVDTVTGETFNPSLPLGGKFILENEKTSKLIDPNEINFNQSFNETKDTVGVSGDKLLELLKTPEFSDALKDAYGYGDYRAIDLETGDLANGSNLKDDAKYALKKMETGVVIDPVSLMQSHDQSAGFEQASLENKNNTGNDGSPKTLVELDTPEKIEVNVNKIKIPVESVNKIKIPVSLGDEDKRAIELHTPERVSVKLDTPRVYVSLGDDALSPDSSNFKAHIGDSQTIEEIKNKQIDKGYKTSNP